MTQGILIEHGLELAVISKPHSRGYYKIGYQYSSLRNPANFSRS